MISLAPILGLASRGDPACNSTLVGRNGATPSKSQNPLTESQAGLRKIKVVPTTFTLMEINQWKAPREKHSRNNHQGNVSYSIQRKGRRARSTYDPNFSTACYVWTGGGLRLHSISNRMGILTPYQRKVVRRTRRPCLLLEAPMSGISPALCPFWLRYLKGTPKGPSESGAAINPVSNLVKKSFLEIIAARPPGRDSMCFVSAGEEG